MADPFISQIIIMGCNFAPRNWSMCQGQLLAISQNQALFALVGTMYGGDGRTSFGLPDGRGRTFIGYNPNSPYPFERTIIGEKGGFEQVQLSEANLPPHTHNADFTGTAEVQVQAYDGAANQNSPDSNYLASGRDSSDARVRNYTDTAPDTTLGGVVGAFSGQVTLGETGSGQSFYTLPPFQAMNYVISLDGIFPPRN